MAVGDRRISSDINICRLNTTDVVAKLRSLSQTDEAAVIETTAIEDTRGHFKGGIVRSTFTGELVIESSPAFRSLIGSLVTYTRDLGGQEESGSGILNRSGVDLGGVDSLQTETFDVQITGTPTLG